MKIPLREMRDQVYGQRCSDNNWHGCFECWILDDDWLKEQYSKLPRPLPPHESLPLPKTT
jgi:hypothetical protein